MFGTYKISDAKLITINFSQISSIRIEGKFDITPNTVERICIFMWNNETIGLEGEVAKEFLLDLEQYKEKK